MTSRRGHASTSIGSGAPPAADGIAALMMVLSGMPEKVPVAARWSRMPARGRPPKHTATFCRCTRCAYPPGGSQRTKLLALPWCVLCASRTLGLGLGLGIGLGLGLGLRLGLALGLALGLGLGCVG